MQRSVPAPPLQVPPGFQRKYPPVFAAAALPPGVPPAAPAERTASAEARVALGPGGLGSKPLPAPAASPEETSRSKALSDLEIFCAAEQGDLPTAQQPDAADAAAAPQPALGSSARPEPRAAMESPSAFFTAVATEEMLLHESPGLDPDAQLADEGEIDSEEGDGDDSAGGELAEQPGDGPPLPETLEVR